MGDFFTQLIPTLSNALGLVGIYVVLALGLHLINGLGGMFSIGHAGFWAIGSYSTAWMVTHNPFSFEMYTLLPTALLFSIAMCALAGFALAIPCLRLSGDYLAIATLGFSIIVVNLLYNMDSVGAATGLSLPTFVNGTVIFLGVAVTLAFCYAVQFSKFGRMIVALREDEIAAQSIGINRLKIKTLIFVLGAATSGVGGFLYAGYANYLNPNGFEFDQSIKILTMVVLGGLGSLTGVALAAVSLTLLPEILRLVQLKEYEMLVFALLLLTVVIVRPQGIFGGKEIWDLFQKNKSKTQPLSQGGLK